jgi:NADH:ubiquinone oxidoreductase subunit C
MKTINLKELCSFIEEQFGQDFAVYPEIQGDFTVRIPAEILPELVGALMDKFDVFHLSAITAQQREDNSDEVELLYHFWQGEGFSLLTAVPTENPEIASLIQHIPGADFYEREVAEMFGVIFTGREETPRLLLSEKWNQGPPFRQNKGSEE